MPLCCLGCCRFWFRSGTLLLLPVVVARANNTPMDAVIAETTLRENIGRSSVHSTYFLIHLLKSNPKSEPFLFRFLPDGTKGILSQSYSSFSLSDSPSKSKDPFEIFSVDIVLAECIRLLKGAMIWHLYRLLEEVVVGYENCILYF